MNSDPTQPNDFPTTDRRALLAGIGGLAAGALLAGKVHAGPLNPPPGPIAPTPGPEPRIPINQTNTPGNSSNIFRITLPGSYYLTGNITGEAGKSGISIESDNVTIDLMGYTLRGVTSSNHGIFMTDFRTGIAIRNGTVSNWGQNGISARIDNGAIEQVNCNRNGLWGIQNAGGFSLRIHACGLVSNGLSTPATGGIFAEDATTITDCQVRSNASHGIFVVSACTVTNCVAIQNGVSGINVGNGCIVRGNACRSQSTGAGIRIASNHNRIEDNICTANSVGIQSINSGNFIVRNTCSNNATNWNIAANNACLVINATLAAAFTGNSGGVSPGSTNPNANYTL